MIQLIQCRVSPAKNIANSERAFIIESPEKSFIVWSKTPADRDAWLGDIQGAMDALKSKVDAETGNIAPVWTPDGDCLVCEYCESPFTMILRRHHCRNCGAICCDSCSRKRFLVSHIHPTKEQRVCDECYTDLSTGNLRASVNISDLALGELNDPGTPGSPAAAMASPPKSNLPKRGRQSVILRGLDVDGGSDSPGSGLSRQGSGISKQSSTLSKQSSTISRQASGAGAPKAAGPNDILPAGSFVPSSWVSARDHEVHYASGAVVVENPLVKLRLQKPVVKRGMGVWVYGCGCVIWVGMRLI